MNPVNIVSKTVQIAPAHTVVMTSINWRTHDDPFQRRLRIIVNGRVQVVVEGAEYDALGQWTDETIKGVILT